jgi:HEAT repeat protein
MSRRDWTNDKLFSRLLNNRSDKTYWDNIRELRSRANREVFQKSFTLANSGIDREKIIGIDLLSQLGKKPSPFYKKTIGLYLKLLQTQTNPEVLYSVLMGIGHNNQNLTLQQSNIITAFKVHDNTDIRQGVVFAMLGVKNKIAIETLIFLTNDRKPIIRDWATFGIGSRLEKNTKTIIEALWQRVNDKDQNTKLEAIVGLASRKDKRVVEVIKRELKMGEFGTLLFDAIKELKDKDFLPLLKENLKKARNDNTINPTWVNDLRICIKTMTSS